MSKEAKQLVMDINTVCGPVCVEYGLPYVSDGGTRAPVARKVLRLIDKALKDHYDEGARAVGDQATQQLAAVTTERDNLRRMFDELRAKYQELDKTSKELVRLSQRDSSAIAELKSQIKGLMDTIVKQTGTITELRDQLKLRDEVSRVDVAGLQFEVSNRDVQQDAPDLNPYVTIDIGSHTEAVRVYGKDSTWAVACRNVLMDALALRAEKSEAVDDEGTTEALEAELEDFRLAAVVLVEHGVDSLEHQLATAMLRKLTEPQ